MIRFLAVVEALSFIIQYATGHFQNSLWSLGFCIVFIIINAVYSRRKSK